MNADDTVKRLSCVLQKLDHIMNILNFLLSSCESYETAGPKQTCCPKTFLNYRVYAIGTGE